MRKINIGCGRDIKKGWDNLDSHNKKGANIIWDLNRLPLPIKDKTYDYILCSQVLEDLADPLPLMEELVRIAKVGGLIEITVSYETSCHQSIYHKSAFTFYSFTSFVMHETNYEYGPRNLKIIKLGFYPVINKGKTLPNDYRRFVSFFYNLFPINIVENTFVKYLFPCSSIKVIYKRLK